MFSDPKTEEQESFNKKFIENTIPHLDVLYNFALYISGSFRTAANLLYITYLKAYGFYQYFVEGADHKDWLFRIMMNTWNEQRSERQENFPQEELDEVYENLKITQPDSKFIKTLNEKDFIKTIAQLPEDYRKVFILKDIVKFSFEKISDLVDCPTGTAITRLYKARKYLLAYLNKNFGKLSPK